MALVPAVAAGNGYGIGALTANAYYAAGSLHNDASLTDSIGGLLYGQVDSANWAGGAQSIFPWALQTGTFAAGFYEGFERWEFTYAKQDGATSATNWSTFHAGMTKRIFIPFDPIVILYGYQALVRHDATNWNDASIEFWQLRFQMDGTILTDAQCSLPHGRWDSNAPGASQDDGDSHDESRWRYVTCTGAIMPATDSSTPLKNKGYRSLKTRITGNIYAPDRRTAKVLTPSGGLWLVAIR